MGLSNFNFFFNFSKQITSILFLCWMENSSIWIFSTFLNLNYLFSDLQLERNVHQVERSLFLTNWSFKFFWTQFLLLLFEKFKSTLMLIECIKIIFFTNNLEASIFQCVAKHQVFQSGSSNFSCMLFINKRREYRKKGICETRFLFLAEKRCWHLSIVKSKVFLIGCISEYTTL